MNQQRIVFDVARVANGYVVNTEDACHIAPTQKEVGEVVRTICRGAFKDEDGIKPSPKGQEKKGE